MLIGRKLQHKYLTMRKIKIPVFIRNKYFWQASLALLSILFLIFFIRNERFELVQIRATISKANIGYVGLGLSVVVLYLLLQAWLYVWSFSSLGQKLSFKTALLLFLKRNLVGVFVPGGTLSSLAFFNKDLDKHQLSKTQQYLGSYIFALASTVSIIVVAVPALVMLFLKNELNAIEVLGFVLIAGVIVLLAFLLYSLFQTKHGWGYKIIEKYKPDWLMILDEIAQQSVSKTKLIQTILISIGIEIIGVVHLYISMLALNATPSFEVAFTGYVAMIILLSISPFLKGLGAIELSLTYLLVQFGYSNTLAASVTLLFRFFEFWLPLFIGALIFLFKREGLFARLLPSIIILVLGITNIVSALTPAIPDRLVLIQEWFPQQITEFSNFTVLAFGLVLIILSIYLFIGSKNAWVVAVFLTLLSMAGHLIKAADYEEAIVALVAFSALIMTRKSYKLKSVFISNRKSLWKIVIPFAIFAVYSVAGFYFLDKVHFRKDFSFIEALNYVMRTLFVHYDYSIIPNTRFANHFLFSVRLSGFLVLVYSLWYIFKSGHFADSPNKTDRERAIALIGQYGKSRMDYFKAYFDKLLFFNIDKTGFLAYRISNNYAVVLENPVAPTDEIETQLLIDFDTYCTNAGLIPVYYRIPEESLEKFRNIGFSAILIGQEAIVDVKNFNMDGSARRVMRNTVKRIQSAGYAIKVYEPPLKDGLLQKLKQVSDEWLNEHHSKEIVFTQGIFDVDELRSTTIMTLENPDEKVMAFVNLIADKDKQEGTIDLMRKVHETPNGTMDYVFIKMFEYFKSLGYATVNLGMAPLAGFPKGDSLKQRATFYLVEYLKRNSRFLGLYEFKEKYDPLWANRYLAYQNTFDLLKMPLVLSKISKL